MSLPDDDGTGNGSPSRVPRPPFGFYISGGTQPPQPASRDEEPSALPDEEPSDDHDHATRSVARDGTPFLVALPPAHAVVVLNAHCEHRESGCESTRFVHLGRSNFVCAGCERVQHITPKRGAHFWATRRWQLAPT